MRMYKIEKRAVMDAYGKVKANKGASGVDKVSLEEFEKDLKNNLYKIWNRMTSGSYFPPNVRMVEIPKSDGKTRTLGIPTVGDRVAQMVAKMYLEPILEPYFHEDSYGYRPNRSAHDALSIARTRCFEYEWVIDLDIKGFFDNLNHELVMKAVEKHTDCKWLLLYIKRWLKAPMEKSDGQRQERNKGTPQGGVISPLLSNLFLHYAFDEWMKRNNGKKPFERYADDIIVHCRTYEEAKLLLDAIRDRLKECKLELHPEKTKIVYCKKDGRESDYSVTKFEFLSYEFRPRLCKARNGSYFVGFTPAMSPKAESKIRQKIKEWKLYSQCGKKLEDIANKVNPQIRGWLNYYGKYNRSALYPVLQLLNTKLAGWAKRKYKNLRGKMQAICWIEKKARMQPGIFAHWQAGIIYTSGQ